MITNNILPWQQSLWTDLVGRNKKNQLSHATLFVATEQIAMYQLVQAYAQYLFCSARQTAVMACGKCQSCRLFLAKQHPDYYHLKPEADYKAIKVDAIRSLIKQLEQSSHQNQFKIVVIESADCLNQAASNALLKTLEEAAAYQTYFFLTTTRYSRLLATIRSRCQTLKLLAPRVTEVSAWLKSIVDLDGLNLHPALTHAFMQQPLQLKDWYENAKIDEMNTLYNSFAALKQKSLISKDVKYWQQYDFALVLRLAYIYIIEDMKKQALAQASLTHNAYADLMEITEFIQNSLKQIQAGIAVNQVLCLENLWLRLSRL